MTTRIVIEGGDIVIGTDGEGGQRRGDESRSSSTGSWAVPFFVLLLVILGVVVALTFPT